MNIKILIALLFIGSLFTAAYAADKAPTWDQLSKQQQSIFKSKGLESSWNKMPEQKRQSIVRGLAQWKAMGKKQRVKAKKRVEKWKKLSEAERKKLRKEFLSFQKLTPAQKKVLRDNFKRYQALSNEQKQVLKKRFEIDKAQAALKNAPREESNSDNQRSTPVVVPAPVITPPKDTDDTKPEEPDDVKVPVDDTKPEEPDDVEVPVDDSNPVDDDKKDDECSRGKSCDHRNNDHSKK